MPVDANPRQTLGARVRQRRTEAGLTLDALGSKLRDHGLDRGNSTQHLSEVERGGSWPSANLVHALDLVLKTDGELLKLLRNAKVPVHRSPEDETLVVTAHLFFPLLLRETPQCAPSNGSPTYPEVVPRVGILSATDHATVHCFPFGVVVLHEQFDLTVRHLGEIAQWRCEQLARGGTATAEHLEELGIPIEVIDHEPYCFTSFVFRTVPWNDAELLSRATQVLAMPSALVSKNMTEEDMAQRAASLLTDSTPITDIYDFSHTGSHFGAATWAAASLMPLDDSPNTDIVQALIDFEVQLQAFWCYASNVGAGSVDPLTCDPGFLKKVLAKLRCPSPTEHTAVRRLREALVQTSRITELVNSATAVAYDVERI